MASLDRFQAQPIWELSNEYPAQRAITSRIMQIPCRCWRFRNTAKRMTANE
jgi:hypothetical protein